MPEIPDSLTSVVEQINALAGEPIFEVTTDSHLTIWIKDKTNPGLPTPMPLEHAQTYFTGILRGTAVGMKHVRDEIRSRPTHF